MKISSYSNRVGGFVSYNSGTIVDCYTDSKIKYKTNAAGFAFENSGSITRSVVQKRTFGKENIAAFCSISKGEIKDSGFVRYSKNKKDDLYIDQSFIVDCKNAAEAKSRLSLSSTWYVPDEKSDSLGFTEGKIKLETSAENAIEISNAEQLFSMAKRIASGDVEAASSSYILTKDINLHGKKWLPIGLYDSTPFTGTFNGNGFRISNFKIVSKGLPQAGFFGCIKNGCVANLTLDCVLNAKDGSVSGGMCAFNDGGNIINCTVIAKVSAQNVCGGFCGKNSGTIARCCFIGKVTEVIPIILFLLPILSLCLLLLIIGCIILWQNFNSPYKPITIDPNGKPIVDNTPVTPPPAGSNRISFELNQEVYANVETGVAIINYVNPKRSTQDVVIKIVISDAELLRTIGRTGRSEEEQNELEASGNYDPESTYQTLYTSGRLQIGYELELAQLSALPDGTMLPEGDYEMIVTIDAYDPETFEKSVVNARAPITVHIVKSLVD